MLGASTLFRQIASTFTNNKSCVVQRTLLRNGGIVFVSIFLHKCWVVRRVNLVYANICEYADFRTNGEKNVTMNVHEKYCKAGESVNSECSLVSFNVLAIAT